MSDRSATVTLLTGRICPYYAEVLHVLDEVSKSFPLKIREVLVGSVEADDLIEEHAPAMLPLVLVDGAYLGEGPLSRETLEQVLAARTAAAPA
ncbi:hypothetical protein ATJ97_2265 [Georgenia soli]|uniref:Uncharacterized protein n=1 Tax=Georgenia soli TaxID=638953 RepID=A0A2A9ENC2_9MICO|nr:glutaredoxin [Georgenia soli]PFG39752.1 hypothetical protein ATJ97_2265 [Georgenia soli]